VRARMGDILSTLEHSSFVEFVRLFRPEEGRMGITVTFVAILELVREGLIDIVQAEPFAPLHVRAASSNRTLRVVADNDVVSAVDAAGTVDAGTGDAGTGDAAGDTAGTGDEQVLAHEPIVDDDGEQSAVDQGGEKTDE